MCMLHCLIIALLDNGENIFKNMRLGRNFRKYSVPIGKKRPLLRKGKATEYLAWV